MNETVQASIDILVQKLQAIKFEDKNRGLYFLKDRQTVKGGIAFPDIFEGKAGENLYKFLQKFEQAILNAQVCERDKINLPKIT